MELIGSEDNAASESEWTRVWRTSVLDNTWNRLLTEDGGKPGPGYVALKLRAEFPDANSDELAEKMSVRTGTAVRPDNGRQILKRARNRFASHLLDEVRGGLDSETDDRLQEELAALGLLEFVRDFLPDAEK